MGISIFELSEEQKAAVDISKNIAVSAGAGSGKTRVLTNRYLKLLEDGIKIEEIAAITFTEKAALEMKERIRSAINEKILKSNGKDKVKWRGVLDKLIRANISTIHGFCAKIIRENSAAIGIDFKFSIINDIDKNDILMSSAARAIEEHFNNPAYENLRDKLIDLYSEEYFSSKVIEELLNIRTKIMDEGKTIKEFSKECLKDETAEFFLSILLEVEKSYMEHKLKEDLLDYNDLENLCCQILADKKIATRYKDRYTRFLVDEVQDINHVQKNIIYSFVTDENNKILDKRLFIVGDGKQSIYGFRGANYKIFKEVSSDIGEDGNKGLRDCYRSKPEIIEGINQIFKSLIDNYEPLQSPKGKGIKGKRLTVLTYKNNQSSSVLKEVKEIIKDKTAALEQFNNALQNLKDSYDKANTEDLIKDKAVIKAITLLKNKGLKFKDICILVRSSGLIQGIEEGLKKYNIPYCIIGGKGFYSKPEITEILNLLQVINYELDKEWDKQQEKKLIRTLRSYIFNIPDDLLYKIKIEQLENNCVNYFEAALYTIDGMKNTYAKEGLNNAYLTLKKLIELKNKLSVAVLIKNIIDICKIKEKVFSELKGIQKFRNIEKLILAAETYDKEELFSIEEFLNYIEGLNDNNLEDGEASLDTEDAEAVKIMTIHQSKGLEFEAVIIPGMEKDKLYMTKMQSNKENFVFYNDKIVSKKLLNGEDSVEFDDYKNSKLLKEVEESIRILYVAMTRAKKHIVMVSKELTEKEAAVSKINEEIEKINTLNTFMKQINYSIKIGKVSGDLIDFINYENASDMDKVESDLTDGEEIEKDQITQKLLFKIEPKQRKYISASIYMKYKKCPRRYYVEKVLNLKGNSFNFSGAEEDELVKVQEEEMINNLENLDIKENLVKISASELGSLTHKVLEYKTKEICGGNMEIIHKAFVNMFGEENKLEAEIKSDLYSKVEKFIKNYEKIEKNREVKGELVFSQNELSFTSCPVDNTGNVIVGFIDRLEVYKKEDKYCAVIIDYKTNRIYKNNIEKLTKIYAEQLNLYGKAIKDSLYIQGEKIDEVELLLYFLDAAALVKVNFDEEKILKGLKEIEAVTQNKSVESYKKSPEKECEKCDYNKLCNCY